MSTPVLPDYAAPFKPVPNVTPFTIRDGATMLKKIDYINKYIDRVLIPWINENFAELADDFEEQVNILIAAVNAAIQAVIDDSIELQDPVMAGIVADLESQTRELLDTIYASKTVEATVAGHTTQLATINTNVANNTAAIENIEAVIAVTLTPEQFGAVGDGVTNDQPAFDLLIDALTDGFRVVADSRKTYSIDDTIHLFGLSNGNWQGGKFKFNADTPSTSGGLRAILIDGCDNLTVSDIYIEQVNQAFEYSGISVDNSQDVTLYNCHAHNFRWVGVGSGGGLSRRITFNNCIATQCRFGTFDNGVGTKWIGGRYSSEWSKTAEFLAVGGVWNSSSLYYDGAILGGTEWSMLGVTFDDNGQSGVYGALTSGGTISGCHFKGNWNKGIDFGATTSSEVITNITIVNNILEGNKTGDISGVALQFSSIIGNTVNPTSESFGIGLHTRCDGNIVSHNLVVSTATTVPAIFVESTGADPASNNIVTENIVGATVPYSVDGTVNIFNYGSNGQHISRSTYIVDKQAATGFNGRLALSLLASADNAQVQMIVNKPLWISDAAGVQMPILVGDVDSTGYLKAKRMGTGARPTAATAGQGAMYYDVTLSKPIFSNGTVWHDANGNPA